MSTRTVAAIIEGTPTSDGAGVQLNRYFGKEWHERLDPFLMLDVFFNEDPSSYIAGFPNHPHRGFETLTYMVEGQMRHADNAGHTGLLQTGGAQWMCAGRGIIHSEMPEQTEGRMRGMQLWINLPSHAKMQKPDYKDMQPSQIPEVLLSNGQGKVRVILGSYAGVSALVERPDSQVSFLDVHLQAGQAFTVPAPEHQTVMVLVYEGTLLIQQQRVTGQQLAVCAQNASTLSLVAEENLRCIVLMGTPLKEPIVQYGPFVMNTVAEVQQAVRDYQQGLF